MTIYWASVRDFAAILTETLILGANSAGAVTVTVTYPPLES